jgi:hypothetical protein
MATAKEEWEATIAEKMADANCSRSKASIFVAKENPELRQRLIEEANTRRQEALKRHGRI